MSESAKSDSCLRKIGLLSPRKWIYLNQNSIVTDAENRTAKAVKLQNSRGVIPGCSIFITAVPVLPSDF
jgi:hypothetical protein